MLLADGTWEASGGQVWLDEHWMPTDETLHAPVANNHPWGKTDGRYVKRLVQFRDQADDVMHRQISRTPCVLTPEDMLARAAVNRFLLGCVSKLA